MKAARGCLIDGCERGLETRGLCGIHYKRQLSRGEIELLPRPTAEDRLRAGLERKPNGCLEWAGDTDRYGYGRIWFNGKTVQVHRLAWEIANGPIPDGLHVLHRCDNPPCGDVENCLFLGTNMDNVEDKVAKGRGANGNSVKTHCKNGHEFTVENTYVTATGRRCRQCHAAYNHRAWRESKASEICPWNEGDLATESRAVARESAAVDAADARREAGEDW